VTTRDTWSHFEVALTGAFLTGTPLRVPIADYERFQEDLCAHLRTERAWEVHGARWRGVETYGGGGGYTNLVPLVLLRRDGKHLEERLEEEQQARPGRELQWLHAKLDGWSWKLQDLRIEMYDLGVGTITGVYAVSVPDRTSAATAQRTIDAIGGLRKHPDIGGRSPVAESFEALTYATVKDFSAAVLHVAPRARQEPWLAPMLEALGETKSGDGSGNASLGQTTEWGRLLWLHQVIILTDRLDADASRLTAVGQLFVPAFFGKIPYWHGMFMPGVDSSVIVLRGDSPEGPNPPLHLTELMWAYYALFMEMDRGLLALLDNDRWRRAESLRALEQDAERMFDIYMRVQEARARLDSALTELAGGQLSIWRGMKEVQKFDELISSVDAKVQLLQRIAERRVQEASAARAQRASRILGGLTALTVVTVAVALMGNFIGTSSIGVSIGWRVLIVIMAFALAVFLYLQAQREIARTRRAQSSRGPSRQRADY
jgi:hypothetical protein